MGQVVIVAHRPKPGQADALDRLVRDHVPQLRAWGLATERPSLIARARDGTVVEVFEWQDGAIERAHSHPGVHAMWERFGAACDYVPLSALAEAQDMFATFTPA